MIFNTEYQLTKIFDPLTQEQIYNTPGFFALSYEDIISKSECPEHLKAILNGFPWSGRPNFVQVRIQDYRKAMGFTLGTGWHVDINTQLATGTMHLAKSLDEFRSMTVSFGNVSETEFVKGPFEVDTTIYDPYNHVQFASHVASRNPDFEKALPNQLAIYTTRDIHRASSTYTLGNIRLIIVTVECDEPLEAGAGFVVPSLKAKGL